MESVHKNNNNNINTIAPDKQLIRHFGNLKLYLVESFDLIIKKVELVDENVEADYFIDIDISQQQQKQPPRRKIFLSLFRGTTTSEDDESGESENTENSDNSGNCTTWRHPIIDYVFSSNGTIDVIPNLKRAEIKLDQKPLQQSI